LDRLDQIEFRALVASNPVAKRFESQVEKLVRQEAAKGYSVTRETALKFALGEALLEKTKSAAGKQKPAGAARVAAQTTRTTRAGADVGSERARAAGVNALEKRLENMKL
jgi:hypothetical protein